MANIQTMKVDSDGAIPWKGKDRHYTLEGEFDFSATNAGSSDTVELFEVAADQLLLGVTVKILTAEGGTATADIGLTGGDVDLFIDGADLNAAAGTVVKSGDAGTKEVVVANGGHYFTAADTIDLLANNALDAAKIKVTARLVDHS